MKNKKFHFPGETERGELMTHQNIQNFKLGSFHHTKATASSGLALLMTFAKDIGLVK
jgi:hypothetical protein